MCGRFVSVTVGAELADAIAALPGLGRAQVRAAAPPRWNVAPTHPVQIVVPAEALAAPAGEPAGAGEAIIGARWGLIPHWAREVPRTPWFNARGETLAERPAFRDAHRGPRCLVPVDGWYEWRHRRPWYCAPASGGPLFLAGLWTRWRDRYTATIVTTDAVGDLGWLHDRMPRVLAPGDCARWLRGAPDEVADLRASADPGELPGLRLTPADPAVGRVGTEGPELLDSAAAAESGRAAAAAGDAPPEPLRR